MIANHRHKTLFMLTILALLNGPALVLAADWAADMFNVTEHDFGTVARGSKAEFEFVLENSYEEEVQITGIRSSCGCAVPELSRRTLKTWEKASILAKFDSRKFLGQKNATITVSFEKPYQAEVQLRVRGFIRGDIVLRPASLEFGDVTLGEAAARVLAIDYVGRPDWKLVDVRSPSKYLQASLKETSRTDNQAKYELTIRLRPNSPPGYLSEQVALITNDEKQERVPFMVLGRVLPPVTVSPASLTLGVLHPGEEVTKKLVVRARKPFRVTKIECDDDHFTFQKSDDLKTLHLVPVTFTAVQKGSVSREIRVATSLDPEFKATCTARATVE